MTDDLITRMRQAMEAAKQLGPAPLRKIKIHPDDFDELKRECLKLPKYPQDGELANTFLGVDLVLDEEAPRLPRRPAP